jgi:sec-independent protein translocase protein TatB
MFEVAFQELVVVFGVSLVVLGPKRLPGLVNKVGRWVGKARSMARDFRQQLENEVNLEELNKMTELQGKAPQTPPPPPGFNGEPLPEPAGTPTYPYSAPDAPQTDDTFSHAHAEGAAPMPYEPEPEVAEAVAVADAEAPTQANLDLSTPDESHLPPDDARRST